MNNEFSLKIAADTDFFPTHVLHFYSTLRRTFTRFPANNRLHNFLSPEKLITSVQLFPQNNEFLLVSSRYIRSVILRGRFLEKVKDLVASFTFTHCPVYLPRSYFVSSNKQRLREDLIYFLII